MATDIGDSVRYATAVLQPHPSPIGVKINIYVGESFRMELDNPVDHPDRASIQERLGSLIAILHPAPDFKQSPQQSLGAGC